MASQSWNAISRGQPETPNKTEPGRILVVLPDVGVGSVKQLTNRWQGTSSEHLSELPSHLSVPGVAALPAGTADRPDDGVDLLDDYFYDGRRPLGRVLFEYLG